EGVPGGAPKVRVVGRRGLEQEAPVLGGKTAGPHAVHELGAEGVQNQPPVADDERQRHQDEKSINERRKQPLLPSLAAGGFPERGPFGARDLRLRLGHATSPRSWAPPSSRGSGTPASTRWTRWCR